MPKVILDYDKSYKKGIIVSDYLDVIRAYFSIPNPDVNILKKKYGPSMRVEERIYGITSTGRFEIGLYFSILQYLLDSNIMYDVITTKPLKENILIGHDIQNFKMPILNLTPREYQTSGVERGLTYGFGTFLVGTGGGKTLLMALMDQALREYHDDMVDLIAMPANLIKQTEKEFINFGIPVEDISIWGPKSDLEIKPIIIASYQTMAANLTSFKKLKPKPIDKKQSKQEYKEYLTSFKTNEQEREKKWKKKKKGYVNQLSVVETMQLDEVHSLRKGNNINKILTLIPYTHRYGYTGTLPEGQLDKWNILGKIGPVLEDVNSYELREAGYLSPVTAIIIRLNYKNPIQVKPDSKDPTKAYIEESEWIFRNEYRNSKIYSLCKKFKNNALIVVDKLEHGDILYNMLNERLIDKDVYWINGSVDMDTREDIRELMENKDNIICIAMSRCFSTGINIKNLHYVIFMQGGKAKIKLVQSIGRGLRLHDTKDKLIIFDITDELLYGTKHLLKRIDRYTSEKIPFEIKDIFEP